LAASSCSIATRAAEFPIGGDQGVEQSDFDGRSGPELLAIAFGEGIEFGGIFAGDDAGLSVNAKFEGIEAGDGC
jgi:hypothetical protein